MVGIRIQLARKISSGFGAASVAGTFVPFSHLVVTPGILASMVYTISRIMGMKMDKMKAKQVSF